MSDPIRDAMRARRPGGFTLPDPPPAPPDPPPVESLTPGGGAPAPPLTADEEFRAFLADVREGVHGT